MKGFTILETLIAISIFTVAVLGPLNLATYSIRLSSYSRNQTTAFYLAEEVMEYIRNKRDSNALAGESDWLKGLNQCFGANGCYIDVPQDNINPCGANCPKLKFESIVTGFYGYSSGEDTLFTRQAWIDKTSSYEARIVVEMSWKERFLDKGFVIEGYIYDWK